MSESGLRYLLEALNAGSMRAASDRLNVAASSISRQITQLEETYGLALIEKGRRGVKLTQAGEIVIAHYRNQLAERETLRLRLEELRSVKSGQVVLAVGEGFLGTAFTQLIAQFNRDNPQIRLELIVASSQEILQSIINDEAHLGLVFQTPHDPKVNVRTVLAQPLMAIVAPDHPLAAMESASFADLARHRLCLAPHHFRLRQILSAAESRHGLYLEAAIITNSINTMQQMVKMGGMVAVLPQLSIWSELQNAEMVAVPIADDTIEHTTLSLILRSGRQLEGAPARMLKRLELQLRHWNQPLERTL